MQEKKKNTKKYLCVHGHFYQPPRENPWIDYIQCQRSAEPYHDWNERITRECYGPNCRSRLNGEGGLIERLVNNYEYMSYNFGPTLFTWLEKNSPWIYRQIIEADIISIKKHGGHGNAIAQVYNHVIMPLASKKDKITQIRWGIADFRHRFGREPEGMWLSETAVDMETLNMAAQEGIKFTILSPEQAEAVRPIIKEKDGIRPSEENPENDRSKTWSNVSGGRIDTTMPYRVQLDEKNNLYIDVFFYNGPLSRAIAYEKMLSSGENLLKKIREVYSYVEERPELVNLATDGESYGHHFKFGEMALTWVFNSIKRDKDIILTNYGQFLDLFPPEMEVKIVENSSWSCFHGIERWRSDCGCNVSHNSGWNQAWRTPLRQGLDRLSGQLFEIYEKQAGIYLKDCLKARDEYITMLLEPEKGEKLFQQALISPVDQKEKGEVLSLLESQRMAMFMFTSCGWFFDDISGLEVRQILMYASRAIELCKKWAVSDLEDGLLQHLEQAKSNDPQYKDGANVYREFVKPSQITPAYVAAHYAISRLEGEFLIEPWLKKLVISIEEEKMEHNETRALIGKVRVIENRTGVEQNFVYFAVCRNGCGSNCIVGADDGKEFQGFKEEMHRHLSDGAYDKCMKLFSAAFPESSLYKLEELITDTKRWIINALARKLGRRIKESIGLHRSKIDDFIELLKRSKIDIPHDLLTLFKIIFTDTLYDVLRADRDSPADFSRIRELIELFDLESATDSINRNEQFKTVREFFKEADIRKLIQSYLKYQIKASTGPGRSIHLKNITGMIDLINYLPIEIDLWEFQNIYYDSAQDREYIGSLKPEDLEYFKKIGDSIGFIRG